MSDRACDCLKRVIAMIPMPISHVAYGYAKRYCEWGLPADAIAIGILEFLIGPGLDDWDNDKIREEHLAIAKALMEGRDGVELLKETAKSRYFSEKIELWKDICKKLGMSPNLTSNECRVIYSGVLLGRILSVSDALLRLQSLRPLPKESTPERDRNLPNPHP
ncbi:hypothetical protein [Stenotrophomonas indicatrix]|uniref:Uncharacterized protein n=1 Tax=Stenotrophomonas indicatrix TaxID=2045451 RepID=A0A1W1H4E9_9GAMM|nr:hypothetical protein [Stenotrophomonas indicatrix]MBN5141395.1 hypothetical protein [Stenotrophomonas maltophilia]SLM26374.1 hypothetical protein SAMN04488690_4141 [Stenotrophomonas indicatrix]